MLQNVTNKLMKAKETLMKKMLMYFLYTQCFSIRNKYKPSTAYIYSYEHFLFYELNVTIIFKSIASLYV